MIAVFAGCRYLDVGPWWWPALDAVRDEHGITEVWHGACGADASDSPDEVARKMQGADRGVEAWALDRGLQVQRFPAPWKLYHQTGLDPKAAGMRRAADMLEGQRGYVPARGRYDPEAVNGVGTAETLFGRVALCVCLPGGPGTQGTATRAKRLGLPVVRVPMQWKPGVPRIINAHHYAEPGKSGDRRPPLPEGWIYIGRSKPWGGPSPLANPYPVERYGKKALELHKDDLRAKLKRRDSAVLEELRRIPADALLVCHCVRPDGSGACHGRTVALAWEWVRALDAKRAASAA